MEENILVNFSNHPSERWEDKQRKAAEEYGRIVDIPFPQVPPEASGREVQLLAHDCLREIEALHPSAVMCQGEFTLSYAVVAGLLSKGIPCLAACSERMVRETVDEDGNIRKESRFEFVRFREYGSIG